MAKMGRRRVEIDWKEFEALCAIQATLREMACFFSCSEDTIQRAVKRNYRETFAVVFAQKRQKGFISLRRTMWQGALGGSPGLQIFLAKQYLGMADAFVVNPGSAPVDTLAMDLSRLSDAELEQLDRLVETAAGASTASEPQAQAAPEPAAPQPPAAPDGEVPPPPAPLCPANET